EAQMPIHIALGNHDNREHFWGVLEAEKTAKRPLEDKQTLFIATPNANWFVLIRWRKRPPHPGFSAMNNWNGSPKCWVREAKKPPWSWSITIPAVAAKRILV